MQAMKAKSIILYSKCHAHTSSTSPPLIWVDGLGSSNDGFSIRPRVNSSGVGASMAMSKSGTPFKGVFAKGNGGQCGKYVDVQPVLNGGRAKVELRGTQSTYIKSLTSNTESGMINTRYRWIKSGKYPNNWVQPDGNQNLTDNHGQQAYIEKKMVENVFCKRKELLVVNPLLPECSRPTHYFTPGASSSSSSCVVTKTLLPMTSEVYMRKRKQKCLKPENGWQKPFPFAVPFSSRTSTSRLGTGPSLHPSIERVYYTVPPAWYTF